MVLACARPPSSPVEARVSGGAAGNAAAVAVDATQVPLNPRNPTEITVGNFTYAGGLALASADTDRLHGLSDVDVIEGDRLVAVGDFGSLLEARLVLDTADRLAGLTDVRLTPLIGEDGAPVPDKTEGDAEGLAVLPGGDRLVSFERRHRIWLYPASGTPPRAAPAPDTSLPDNNGFEALAADPEAGPDAYIVGAEMSGATWTCRVSAVCVAGPIVEKPEEFGLVALRRLPGNTTVYLLRAYDPIRGNRIALQIFQATQLTDRLDLARPLTVDNFEGVAAVPLPDGRVRFYLLSDDNASDSQRTLLLAFDWRAPR